MITCLLGAFIQLSLDASNPPLESYSSKIGSCNALEIPEFERLGPIARKMTFFGPLPVMINPPIMTLSPVWTKARVEILANLTGGGLKLAQYCPPVLTKKLWVWPPESVKDKN